MTEHMALAPLVNKLTDARVLVVGDLMLDRFVSGEVDRISPEAPIPVLRITSETSMLGGAGNVVRNISSLGGHAVFIASVGEDQTGEEVRGMLEADPLITSSLVVDPDKQTTIKTRYIAGNQQIMRADQENTGALSEPVRETLYDATRKALDSADILVLSDYGKGVLTGGNAAKFINIARQAGKQVIVDPKGNDYECYRGASLVTPNRRELSDATGLPCKSNEEIIAASKQLIANHGIEAVLATRSGDGMSLVNATSVYHLSAEAQEVFDVSGAGDTVVATLATALAGGVELEQAAALANVAAGIVVAKTGTATAFASELSAALFHQNFSDSEAKVTTLNEAMQRIETWRNQGFSVGFTNGCFDLLHPGHISLLGQSSNACDRLIVGLNSDASVKRLKGETRPVQSEMARATVLASLEAIDLVIIFDEDTPLELITALGPDVLIKGADYTIETVVGSDVVTQRGGRVVLAQLEEGHSTTGTIARLSK